MPLVCESSTCTAFLFYVIPALGCVTSSMVYLSPMPACFRVRRYFNSRMDGDKVTLPPPMINPLPYAFQMCNGLAWFMYSIIIQDLFISWVGFTASVSSIFYLLSLNALGLHLVLSNLLTVTILPVVATDTTVVVEMSILDDPSTNTLPSHPELNHNLIRWQVNLAAQIATFGVAIILILTLVAFFAFSNLDYRKVFMGSVCSAIYAIMYASPLSVIVHIFRRPDQVCNLLYMPLSCAAVVNGSLWTIYGAVLNNPFILYPKYVRYVLGI